MSGGVSLILKSIGDMCIYPSILYVSQPLSKILGMPAPNPISTLSWSDQPNR